MEELIIVGDRVLIAPDDGERLTKSGLYLPATVTDQDRVQSGRVVRVGPGYLMPNPEYDEREPWAPRNAVRYLPLQARPGDFAFFLRSEAVALTYRDAPYLILPHGAILALIRPRPEDVLDALDLDDLID
ncbi:co-chaperone GroES [Rhodocaloribacter sp.]